MPNASFQIDREKLDEFDKQIKRKQIDGELPTDASRSDILREMVEEFVEGDDCNSGKAT
jgi:hypothetical protein